VTAVGEPAGLAGPPLLLCQGHLKQQQALRVELLWQG